MSKLVVLTGSPRKNGNSNTMAAAFVQEAEKLGHTVTVIDSYQLEIGGCRDCRRCYSTGKACVFDDDFNTIAQDILEADGIVFAMPVYWYSIPAKLKAIIDKFLTYLTGKQNISGKKWGLICCCTETAPEVPEEVLQSLRRSTELMGWINVGNVLMPGLANVGDVHQSDGCARAMELAKQF